VTSEVTKKNFRSIGQDLTDCQLLLILNQCKIRQEAIGNKSNLDQLA